jgi:CxxC motif-containing protein
MNTTTYLCIGCPLGCRLEVDDDELHHIVEVRGYDCKRGNEYARQEHTDPRRMVTTSITIHDGLWARLPVKTTIAVPKQSVKAVNSVIQSLRVTAPIKLGEVLLRDVLGTGADVVATRDMPANPADFEQDY